MISRIHSKLGTAGFIVAIVALVAALGGGAYAAQQGLNGKQKKEVKKIAQTEAKKFSGVPGPPGPQGNPGAPGAAGAAGKDGADGDDGVSVTTQPATVGECANGGFKWTSASGSGKVCNGAPGTPGTPGEDGACSDANANCEMPPGSTLAGHWGVALTGAGLATSPISFNLRYPGTTGPALHYVTFEEQEEEEVPAECSVGTGAGSVTEPEADPGHLCVFEELPSFAPLTYEGGITTGFGTDPFGVTLFFSGEEFSAGTGTWAVTAPAAP